MDNFDLTKYLANNILLVESEIDEASIAQAKQAIGDVGKFYTSTIAPALKKGFTAASSGVSKGIEFAKKYVNKENASKLQGNLQPVYDDLKKIIKDKTDTKEDIEKLQKSLLLHKGVIQLSAVAGLIPIITGAKANMADKFFGMISAPTGDISWGDPSIWLYVAGVLAAIKVLLYVVKLFKPSDSKVKDQKLDALQSKMDDAEKAKLEETEEELNFNDLITLV
tara:strand:+ start:29 stop:697 length:669 start_codon:yes stop_codon:yes gene_type:complete